MIENNNIEDKRAKYISDFKLDKDNTAFFYASKIVLDTECPLIYLTGKAGTGKTTLLKYISSNYDKNHVILAPTGLAAVNAGGQTIHSFFSLERTPYLPNDERLQKEHIYSTFKYKPDKVDMLKKLSLIIIDEVSMVRCDILDAIDRILRTYRNNDTSFGGVRLLLIGDTFQLPPIAKTNEWSILKQFYQTPYFFNSKVYENSSPIYIQLDKHYRQTETEFLNLLNKIRINNITKEDIDKINSRVISPRKFIGNAEEPILLAPTNEIVNSHNNKRYKALKEKEEIFEAEITGIYPESMYPVDKRLCLKVGAQVMITRNSYNRTIGTFDYYNGNIGIITSIDRLEIEVKLNNKKVKIEKSTWENYEFSLVEKDIPIDEERLKYKKQYVIERIIKGTFTQFPIKLAWAITINKSQGMTFDKINVDLLKCFDYGQVYVALSRCRTMNGIHLQSPISRKVIKTDPRVLSFAQTATPTTLIIEELERGKADKLYKQSRKAVLRGDFLEAINIFQEAIKIRDDRNTTTFERYINLLGLLFKHKKQQASHFYKKFNEIINTQNQLKIENQKKESIPNEKNKKQHANIKASNRMSAAALIKSQNSQLDFIENPQTGKITFECGKIKGYVSPAVVSNLDTVTVNDLQYAEVSIDNKSPIPCIMMIKYNKENIKKTSPSDDLP